MKPYPPFTYQFLSSYLLISEIREYFVQFSFIARDDILVTITIDKNVLEKLSNSLEKSGTAKAPAIGQIEHYRKNSLQPVSIFYQHATASDLV